MRTAVVAGLLALSVSACTASPADHQAWQESADHAVGAAITGVGTAQVVIDAAAQDHLTHPYGVIALTDALDTADGEVATFAAAQPPDDLQTDHTRILTALHEALTLLAEVRYAYASPGLTADQDRELGDRIDDELAALEELSASLTAGGLS